MMMMMMLLFISIFSFRAMCQSWERFLAAAIHHFGVSAPLSCLVLTWTTTFDATAAQKGFFALQYFKYLRRTSVCETVVACLKHATTT